MAKDKAYVAAAAVGVAEVETPDRDAEATPVPEAAPAPAPSEVTTEETPAVEMPAAASEERLITISFSTPIFVSPEAKRVLNQYAGLKNLAASLRTSIYQMLAVEDEMNAGQQLFFGAMAQGTWNIQGMSDTVQAVLTGAVNVDPEGEIV